MTDEQSTEYQNGVAAYYRLYLTDRENLKLPEDAAEWYQKGWDAAERAGEMLPASTPEWILAFLGTTPHGGWIHPIPLTDAHPLVKEDWMCSTCGHPFGDGDVGIIMPFHASDGTTWIANHRRCAAMMLGLDALKDPK